MPTRADPSRDSPRRSLALMFFIIHFVFHYAFCFSLYILFDVHAHAGRTFSRFPSSILGTHVFHGKIGTFKVEMRIVEGQEFGKQDGVHLVGAINGIAVEKQPGRVFFK